MAALINNCIIRGCSATTNGGGVNIDGVQEVTITNVEIDDCSAGIDGGGIYTQNDVTLEVDYIDIHDCNSSSDGAGVCLNGNNAGNDYQFRRSLIHDNIALGSGGGVNVKDHASCEVRLQRCVIHGNAADSSCGGVATESGVIYVVNCTVAYNDEEGVLGAGGTTYVTNCIVWGNDVQMDIDAGTITATYSCVEDGYSGTGNVSGEPVFVGEGKHLYALSGICDAIDSANSGATNYFGVDPFGQSEFDHPDVTNSGTGSPAYADMGAYEFIGIPTLNFDNSYYYLDLNVDMGGQDLYQFICLRIPEMPLLWGGFPTFSSRRFVRHRIQSEIEVDDTTTTLKEWVYFGRTFSAYRLTESEEYSTPTRDVPYYEIHQSDDSEYVAEDKHYLSDLSNVDGVYYAIVQVVWENDLNATFDVCSVYNVDINQIHDLPYDEGIGSDHTWRYLSIGMHPGATLFAPDVPVSAWHIRSLQDSLLRIIYEAVFAQSIPVFGKSGTPVV
jgi:hypothetical protein